MTGKALLNRALALAAVIPTSALAQATPEAAPLCPGTELPLILAAGGSSPHVNVTMAGKTGPFTIDYGYGSSAIEHGIWSFKDDDPRWTTGSDPHGAITPDGFGLPGWNPGTKITFNERNRDLMVAGRPEHGVIGIDLLVRQDLEFRYGGPNKPTVVVSAYGGSCDPAVLKKANLKPIRQDGHWDANVTNPPDGVYSGPVVYIELADSGEPKKRLGVATWAQIDTGYEDSRLLHSVDINEAMLNALLALKPPPTEGAGISVTGCNGSSHQRRTFTAPGRVLRIEDGNGEAALTVDQFTFILKNKAEGCGGIAGTDEPAAQIGASFLRAFGTTILRGPSKEVWIGR